MGHGLSAAMGSSHQQPGYDYLNDSDELYNDEMVDESEIGDGENDNHDTEND